VIMFAFVAGVFYRSVWGFDEATIEMARARSEYFDQIARQTRYS